TWFFELPKLLAYVRSSSSAQLSYGFHSLYGASTLLFDGVSPALATVLAAFLWLTCFAALVFLWRRVGWNPRSPSWKLAWAATIGASTLLAPHLYFYDLTCMLIAFYLLYDAYGSALLDGGRIASSAVWVWVLGLFSPYIAMAIQW